MDHYNIPLTNFKTSIPNLLSESRKANSHQPFIKYENNILLFSNSVYILKMKAAFIGFSDIVKKKNYCIQVYVAYNNLYNRERKYIKRETCYSAESCRLLLHINFLFLQNNLMLILLYLLCMGCLVIKLNFLVNWFVLLKNCSVMFCDVKKVV